MARTGAHTRAAKAPEAQEVQELNQATQLDNMKEDTTMAKKTTTVQKTTTETAAPETTATPVETAPAQAPAIDTAALMAQYPELSLRKLAAALNLNYNMLLKTSKKPIEGIAYDPTAVNTAALDQYIGLRVDPGVISAIDWASLNTEAAAAKVSLPKEFKVGQTVVLRQDPLAYEIVLMTPTHIVLNPVADSTQPRVMNLATFLHQGPRNLDDSRVNLTEGELSE